jgi:hypothetical protein
MVGNVTKATREIENLLELIAHDTHIFEQLIQQESVEKDTNKDILWKYAKQIVKRKYIRKHLELMASYVEQLSKVRVINASLLNQN